MQKNCGMAQDTYERVAHIAAHEDAFGRVNPAIIRTALKHNLMVIDLAEFEKIHPTRNPNYMYGYLVVNYVKASYVYASIDNHYVRKPSAIQRYRNLGGATIKEVS